MKTKKRLERAGVYGSLKGLEDLLEDIERSVALLKSLGDGGED